MTAPAALAFAAGCLGALAAVEAGLGLAPSLRARAPRLGARLAALVEMAARPGREGRDPGAVERRRLLAAAALVGLGAGTFVAGPALGVVAASAAPIAIARVLRSRRE